MYFFVSEWITHGIIPPRTSKFATTQEIWPPQNNMIPCTIHLISADEASPNSRDPNKMHPFFLFFFLAKVVWLIGFRTQRGKGWYFEDNFNKKTVLSLPVPHYQNQLGNLWKSLNKQKNIYITRKKYQFFVASLLTRATVFFQQRFLCLIRKLINAKRSFIIMGGKKQNCFLPHCHWFFLPWYLLPLNRVIFLCVWRTSCFYYHLVEEPFK